MSFIIDKNKDYFLKGVLSGGGGGKNILTQTITQGDLTHAPSADAVFTAIANAVTAAGTAQIGWDASGGTYPTTDKNGDPIKALYYWTISVQGTLNGEIAYVGDILYASVDDPLQDNTKWFVIRKSNGIVSDAYLYVDIAKGSNTNQGTILNPLATVSQAVSQIGSNGGTVYITQNNGLLSETVTINAINNYIVLYGSSASEKTLIDKLYINATSGTVYLVNIFVNEIKASCNIVLSDVKINVTAEYTANNTTVIYDNVDYTSSTHKFIHNGLQSGIFKESVNCKGATLKLPLVLEDVLSVLLNPPANITEGDRYLINGVGTGVWTGNDNLIASAQISGGTANTGYTFNWDYQPLVNENIVSTQNLTPVSYIYNGTTWSEITKWQLFIKEADEISEGLMSATDYEKLLYSRTITNVKYSNNIIDERLEYNTTSGFYEFTCQNKFSTVNIITEFVTPAMTGVADDYPVTGLVNGNIIVILPDFENDPTKSSYDYDGDIITVQFTDGLNLFSGSSTSILVKAQNNRNIVGKINGNLVNISGNTGVVIGAGASIRFRWFDSNFDPTYRTKSGINAVDRLPQWEMIE